MGSRCSKKLVRCGAIGVLALACTSSIFSRAGPGTAPRRDFLAAGQLLPERIRCCLRLLSRQFAVTVILVFPWQIVRSGRQCLASDLAPLPDTNTCGLPCYDPDRSITPACVW